MPGRIRNTKTRSQRIELDYFTKRGFIPRLRRWATYIVAGVGLLWVGWYALGSQAIYNAGTLAPVHQVLNGNCSACHVTHAPLSRQVTDEGCRSCHDGPAHYERQLAIDMPSCASCHLDHNGAIKLAHATDASCAKCHREDLKRPDGHTVKKTTRFDGDHPDFAVSRDVRKDPGAIKFHHKAHLQRAIRLRADGPGAEADSKGTVTLECADCHRPASISQPWPYAAAEIVPVSMATDDVRRNHLANAYMPPVTYEEHCQSCHPLQFDQVVTDLAPHHKTPQEVHEFVQQKFKDYAEAHPKALPPLTPTEPPMPRHPAPPPPRSASEWVKQRVDNAERWLWRGEKGCNECHSLKLAAGSSIPDIVKPSIPTHWFSHAVFDHQPHQILTCVFCHTDARTSEQPTVAIPAIKTCLPCHSAASATPAQTGCFECHVYHKWTKEQPGRRHFKVDGAGRSAKLAPATGR